MIQIKVYLYNQFITDYKGTDLSQYLAEGCQNVEDITQTVDTSEITLHGLNQAQAFDPETKFIIDIVEDGVIVETLHRVVNNDTVTRPIISNEYYYDHAISFNDPSVIAQKRVCDNIAITYKLKDVELETRTTYNLDREKPINVDITKPIPPEYWKASIVSTGYQYNEYKFTWGKWFSWEPPTGEGIKPTIIFQNQDGTFTDPTFYYQNLSNFNIAGEGETPVYKGKFRLPKPAIKFSYIYNTYSDYYKIGYASFRWTIVETDFNGVETGRWTGLKISNSNLYTLHRFSYPTYPYERYVDNIPNDLKQHWLLETTAQHYSPYYAEGNRYAFYFKKYTDASGEDLSGDIYSDLITLNNERTYTLTCEIYEFPDDIPSFQTFYSCLKYTGDITKYSAYHVYEYTEFPYPKTFQHLETNLANTGQLSCSTSVVTYITSSARDVLQHSIPYTAFNLITKALLNSQNGAKQTDLAVFDINHQTDGVFDFNCPFYIDTNFETELKETQVIENFYHQKNLWEILLEAGYYIHAIPYIKFGNNDKFLISFDRLGETTQYTDTATKQTITNFRGIDDYISSTTSYISNLVQLGGKISEWVVPQTTSVDYLVSNDTGCLKTSHKIIELLSVTVKCNVSTYTGIALNATADLTNYIYEKNIYDLLSINYTDVPNKGIAMYYELGDNVIKGGDYQLPRENTDVYSQYAFKKIIYSAFRGYPTDQAGHTTGVWTNFKINDFSFLITYRTKDTARENHTRPDLRKYLINSKFDKYPMHYQFNNQEDTLVDSFKFGNNMYGKLLRTGNLNYICSEWAESVGDLKRKGQLYKINNELYYVAKVTNIYYTNHIESAVEYSKDYNQLSQVVGIPSEPRFYEISEQSVINREVAIEDFLLITTNINNTSYGYGYLNDMEHLGHLIFGDQQADFAKYVVTTFKGDKDVGQNEGNFGVADFYKEILTPLNAYSSGTTLTYEWDTLDNFSAGDKVGATGYKGEDTADNAYASLQAVQYTDKYGKATLFDFYIMQDISNLTFTEVKNLPESPINTQNAVGAPRPMNALTPLVTNVQTPLTNLTAHSGGEILLKDCREQISFNYNLQTITDSDTFVISPFFFLPNKTNVKLVFLSEEVNKFSNGYINTSTIINMSNADETSTTRLFTITPSYAVHTNNWGHVVTHRINLLIYSLYSQLSDKHFTDTQGFARVKSIAFICDANIDEQTPEQIASSKTKFILARNIPSNWLKPVVLRNWYLLDYNQDIFTNNQ